MVSLLDLVLGDEKKDSAGELRPSGHGGHRVGDEAAGRPATEAPGGTKAVRSQING
jgi:hypothetical protein